MLLMNDSSVFVHSLFFTRNESTSLVTVVYTTYGENEDFDFYSLGPSYLTMKDLP